MSGPLSQLDKRMSLRSPRLPFADAHFSPNARRPHSTGISSIPATTARGGQLTDLRPGTDRTQGQAPPLVALNGLNRRDQRARVPRKAQDTAKIVAALRRTAQENRHLCRSLRPMQPIGPPPSLKRPRDEEDIPRRPGKRTRTHTGASASVPVSHSTPRVNVQPTNPRPRPPSVADLQSAPPGTIIGQRRRTNPRSSVGFARSTAISEHAQGILRSKSTAGIDKKRKLGLGRSEEDVGSMKRSAKRRSLSLAAADAEIHKHVDDAIHESTQARASARKSVSFAEPSSSAPESAPDANPPSFAAPALKNSFAAAASTLSSDGDQTNAEIPANSSENIKKPAPTPQVEVTEKEKETSLPEPVTASFRVPSAPFGTISFGAKSQSAEKPPADDPSTAATTPAPTPVAQSAPNPASVAPEKENDAAAVSKRNESLPGFGKETVQKTSALVNENKDEKKEEEPSTNAISFGKSAPSFGSVTFGEPKSTPEGPAATASAPASTSFGQPSSSAATFGIASTAPTTNSASVFGTSASAASFGSSAPTTTFGALSSSPAFGQKSPATSQQVSASSSAAALVTPSSPSLSAPSTFVANQEKAIPEGRKTEGTASSAPSMSQSTAQPSTPFSSTLFGSKAPEAESTTTNVVPMSTAAPVPAAPSSQLGSASSSAFAVTSSAPAFGTSTPAQASGPFSSSASAKPFGVSTPSSVPFGASAAFSASNPFGSESKPAGFGADSNPTFGTQSSAPTPNTTDGPFASFATPKSSKANPFGAFGASSSAGSAPFGSTPTTKGPYLFDVKPNPPSTPFGASSSNPFNSSGASFGAGSAAMSGGFGASTPNTGGGFGSGPFGRNNASGPFGDNNSTSGPFGSGSGGFGTSTPNGAGNFGFGSSGANPFATPTSNASGGGIPFGSNSGSNAFGGFGGGSQPSSGGFGGGGQPAGGFGHAAAPMSATPFGQAPQPQQQQPPFQLSHQANMFQQSGASGTNQFNMGGGGGGQSQGRRRVLRAKRHKR